MRRGEQRRYHGHENSALSEERRALHTAVTGRHGFGPEGFVRCVFLYVSDDDRLPGLQCLSACAAVGGSHPLKRLEKSSAQPPLSHHQQLVSHRELQVAELSPVKCDYVVKNDFDCALEPLLGPQSAPHLFEHGTPETVAPINLDLEYRFHRQVTDTATGVFHSRALRLAIHLGRSLHFGQRAVWFESISRRIS